MIDYKFQQWQLEQGYKLVEVGKSYTMKEFSAIVAHNEETYLKSLPQTDKPHRTLPVELAVYLPHEKEPLVWHIPARTLE